MFTFIFLIYIADIIVLLSALITIIGLFILVFLFCSTISRNDYNHSKPIDDKNGLNYHPKFKKFLAIGIACLFISVLIPSRYSR